MDLIKIALDAMGGDNAPQSVVEGALEALKQREDLFIYLVGQEELLKPMLADRSYPVERLNLVNATEVIENAEHPVNAIRRKQDSSIVVAMKLVKDGTADAFVSAGSSGAILVGGQLIVGRIRGIERAPFAPLMPTAKGFSIILDAGANVDARPTQLLQWAQIGSLYMKEIIGIDNPTVGIVNIGAEEEKGNALVKETFPLLKECKDINFIGSVEARDIPAGAADVIVCDAFVGNVIVKLYEGVASTLLHAVKDGMMQSPRGMIGGAIVKPVLKETLKKYDTGKYPGAAMLGLNGLVVKAHGSSSAKDITTAILQCLSFKEQNFNEKLRESILNKEEEI